MKNAMMRFWVIGFAILSLTGLAAAQQGNQPRANLVDVPARLGYPDMILHNAKVVTMDDASFGPEVGTIHEAMAIRDGKILATGSSSDLRTLAGPETKVIDLRGRTVLPAFIATHEHPTDWMWTQPEALKYALPEDNDFIMVRWMTGTAEEQWANWEATLRDMQATAKPGQWLWLSFSWGPEFENVEGLFEKFPQIVTPEKLDELAPNNPARVRDAWPLPPQVQVNTKGLEEVRKVYDWAGLRRSGSEASDPLGRQTEPDVIFRGRTPELAKILKAEMELWAAHGITTFGSAPYSSYNLQALNYLDQRGEMPGRFAWGYIGPDFSMDTLRYIAGILGNGTDYTLSSPHGGGERLCDAVGRELADARCRYAQHKNRLTDLISLQNHRRRCGPRPADADKPILRTAPLHLIRQRCDDPCTGGGKGVSYGDRASQRVELLPIDRTNRRFLPALFPSTQITGDLPTKGLVHFNDIDV